MTAITVREMARGDLTRLLEIECASFTVPWTRGIFLDQLALGPVAVNVVCCDGDRPIGYAAAWIVLDELHLLSIAVAPGNRRRGAGTLLLDTVIREGRAAGARRVELEVRRGNEAARRFYERHGFTMVGTRRGYYRDTGEDAVLMSRNIGTGDDAGTFAVEEKLDRPPAVDGSPEEDGA